MGAFWTLKEAQEQLETLARAAERGEPQRVTLEGGEEVVVVSKRDYELMSTRPKTFVEHLMDFPKIPEEFEDIFEKRHPERIVLEPRDVDFD